MTNRFKLAGLIGLTAAFLGFGIGGAAAELQECFRDGYLCSIKCDQPGRNHAEAEQCQAHCNAEEKVCVRKFAAERTPALPRYSPASTGSKPLKAIQTSAR